jgi:hypothetical protein
MIFAIFAKFSRNFRINPTLTNCLDDLRQGPAVLPRGELLEVRLVQGPGPVGQHLVEGGQPPHLGGRPVQALQPRLLAAGGQETAPRRRYQLLATVPRARLQ